MSKSRYSVGGAFGRRSSSTVEGFDQLRRDYLAWFDLSEKPGELGRFRFRPRDEDRYKAFLNALRKVRGLRYDAYGVTDARGSVILVVVR